MSAHVITRRVEVEVEFHQVDMVQVVHNSVYFHWFERGRLKLLEEIFPMSWTVEQRVAVPVVRNACEYLSPARYGDRLVVTTRHRKRERWDGRLVLEHSVSNLRTKVELARGTTEVTVIDLPTGKPCKTLPEGAWEKYLELS